MRFRRRETGRRPRTVEPDTDAFKDPLRIWHNVEWFCWYNQVKYMNNQTSKADLRTPRLKGAIVNVLVLATKDVLPACWTKERKGMHPQAGHSSHCDAG